MVKHNIRYIVDIYMVEDIRIKYLDFSNLKGVTASTTIYNDHQYPKHFHDHFTVQWVEFGINDGFTESHTYKIGCESVLIINPGELHAGRSLEKKPLKFHSIRIEPDFFSSFCQKNEINLNSDIRFRNHPLVDPVLQSKVSSFVFLLNMSRTHEAESMLTEWLTELIVKQTSLDIKFSNQSTKKLTSVREFIYDNFQKNLTLDQMAEISCLSPFYFSRQFKNQYGLTPFQYLRNVRVEKAKEVLKAKSISQTALEVGFFDHSHFLRNFKKIEGTTPSQYRSTK
ncbi:MAG: AraC family transcriptional regulator [Reichenbachiella sp.]|uniref:AraC family transcriptional regulator n=1 Tax=Reichenbachiella sp. TaxID=2184521 RepID=UPI00326611BB